MRLKNIFKKRNKKELSQVVQPLDKKQLEKVIGGVESGKGAIPLASGPSGTTN